VSSFKVFKDKISRLYSLQYVKSRVNGEHGKGVQGIIDSTMFFLNGKEQNYHYDKIIDVAITIQSYKEYCDSIGIDFICLPLPNKETVYFDKVPLKSQPDYLIRLDSVLVDKKIKTINTLELFNDYRASNASIIYHLDDTHWNARGVDLVSEKIAKYIIDEAQN
jgi:alginate O-acetyltransferase complex protein AlgJ